MSAWQNLIALNQNRRPLTEEDLAYLLADRLYPEGVPENLALPLPKRAAPWTPKEVRLHLSRRLWQSPEVPMSLQ